MKKIMLFYPPGRFYQRGEDRSQGNVEQSTATSMRAPNDLGYAAATLKREGFAVFLRDYQTERLHPDDLFADFERENPDGVFVSITNSTIFDDLGLIAELAKRKPGLLVMLKGAIFFDPDHALLDQLDLADATYLIGLESDFTVGRLAKAHFENPAAVPGIRGLLYKKDGGWAKTDFSSWETDLDDLPFPDRSLIRNALYVRPDTGEPQATIATSRGCPSACIFCMTPKISGKKLRLRSPENILAELSECYFTHGIRDFFFKSDTFTFDAAWTKAVCQAILDSPLSGKIRWVANSKVKPLERDTLAIMKKAGCWLVAFGYESGSPETLTRIHKNTTINDNLQATKWAKEVGLRTFGFFLIGLPWEGPEHLEATRKHIFELDNDFLELHIAIPYYGTRLNEIARQEGLIPDTVLGKDYFNAPTVGTKHLSMEEIEAFRKKTLLDFHLRPSYIGRKILQAGGNPKILANYARFGLRLLKNTLLPPKRPRRLTADDAPPHALILGANSDIATALARELAREDKATLTLASRDVERLERTAEAIACDCDARVGVCPFDALDTAGHKAFYESLDPAPDIVVVAFGLLGDQKAGQRDFEAARAVIDTNLTGALSILEIAAAAMERQGHGTIVALSSPAGDRGRKSNYLYGAAKAGLTVALSGLRHRLAKTGVHVVTALPGWTKTRMTAAAPTPKWLTATPQRVAADIRRAIHAGRAVVYTPWYWRPIMALVRALPEKLFVKTNL
ncbi:Radical SAM domain protein [Solidesulfovibrio fructosivorans JJ]]|uniref:Radical SAM domain protein n=1 Tax=Solidesulfovibrio fructosivorans JJ] TaxID=596151 RepID=E1JY70_SOLFR|nr:SDR family oxidoreductase [Solidesulfovibrio fructosivorans]EFL50644.1 Radical SAM domain protein [Solidesulfovibrio fructosivorans JJ]]